MKADALDEGIARERLNEEGIIKEEKIMYLQKKLLALQGTLYLTPKRLVLIAHKTTVGGGILGLFLKSMVAKKKFGFDLEFNAIKNVAQGKHGVQTNIVEIVDESDKTFRIVVKDYQEWEGEIHKHR